MKEKIGVYICHCGGNISDYVDVEQITDLVSREKGVAVAKHVMFACADSNQKEMIQDIKDQGLDSVVVCSCSPKLHLHTFRGVAERAGLNPYNYVQVNVREQCSWPHSDVPNDATHKAIGLVRAGIRRVSHSEALEGIEIPTHKSVLVLGAGVAGMRSAIDLARMGNHVYLVEKENEPGGKVREAGRLFPSNESGSDLVNRLKKEIANHAGITLFTRAELTKISGSMGNFSAQVTIRTVGADNQSKEEVLVLTVGSVLTSTGYDNYQPKENEYGFGTSERVVTLPQFRTMLTNSIGSLTVGGKKVNSVAYIYCVGNRQAKGDNKYCSRVCCSSAIHTSLEAKERLPEMVSYHLYRDIRTYGKQELMYDQASKQGDIFLRFDEKDPPQVAVKGDKMEITIKDLLTSKNEFNFEADLVVLVTGMVARHDSKDLSSLLKIPVGRDQFFNEIHPKLKPVETVIKGVFIGGACQGPKNITESVQSSLSAAAKINALISAGSITLEPVIARVNAEACVWCGKCAEVCEYDAVSRGETAGKVIAVINEATCKGCGICAPVCPADAIDIARYSNPEIESMINGFMEDVVISLSEKKQAESGEHSSHAMKEFPLLWKKIVEVLEAEPKTIPQIAGELKEESQLVTWHMMTMNRYQIIESAGMDDSDAYFLYKLKN